MTIVTPKLSAEESRILTRVMTLGIATSLPVVMSPNELVKLIGVIYRDTNNLSQLDNIFPGTSAKIAPEHGFYEIPDDWFTDKIELAKFEHIELIRLGIKQIPNFASYLECLAELHKRRRKYAMILSAQPMPTMIQVSPRALIEYGQFDPEALASWLTWRKFFFDIDNRAAQETGYLFEPILAGAIGGKSMSAKSKVVIRTDDNTKGRQVDCWKIQSDGKPLAYEFKLRVTIAASGQGRFGEELAFAEDCKNSGAIPVLVVLDPTPNPRLSDLKAEFEKMGGRVYIGDDAWAHLEDEAGDTMAVFIEQYVRKPISVISAFEIQKGEDKSLMNLRLLDFAVRVVDGDIEFKIGKHERKVIRTVDASLSDDDSGTRDE